MYYSKEAIEKVTRCWGGLALVHDSPITPPGRYKAAMKEARRRRRTVHMPISFAGFLTHRHVSAHLQWRRPQIGHSIGFQAPSTNQRPGQQA